MKHTLLMLSIALFPGHAPTQEPKTGDEMIQKYLARETDKLSKKFLDGAKSLEEWKANRARLKQEYLYSLGLWPLPKKTDLKATFVGKPIEHEGILIDRLHYQSRPGLYVTANLYRPKGTSQQPTTSEKKYPAVLYVCGHSGRGYDGNKTAYQEHGIWFAKHGYLCLTVDTLQLGEIPGVHHGTYGRPWNHLGRYDIKDPERRNEGPRWWWLSRGYTPAGVECWNGIRGIDYLVSRSDVDDKKIAVTGISGGGAATFWIAAADERVTCAVPVSGMSDLESYVKNKVINDHCDCMFMHNPFQWEWTTIAALVAPRPLLFVNSDSDRIFPMDGNRRIIKKLRTIYKMYGKPELVDEYVSKGGHAYRPDLRVAIFKWINRHVKGETGAIEDSGEYKTLPGKMLRVFPTVADMPKDRINDRIDETFVPVAEVKLPEKGKFEAWKKSLLAKLKSVSFGSFRFPIASAKKGKKLVLDYALHLEDGIRLYSSFLAVTKGKIRRVSVIILSPDTNQEPNCADYGLEPLSADLVMVHHPRGTLKAKWSRKSPPNYVERSEVLLGSTVDTKRVRDIIAHVRFLRDEWIKDGQAKDKVAFRLVGKGEAGIIAAYAALLEPTVKEVVIIDPPTSHKDGPHFLNVMRVLDVPEALGMLAPRKLTLINAKDKAFDRTAKIYEIAGAKKQLIRK